MTDISPLGVVSQGKGGGVLSLFNDPRRGRSVACYPIPNTTNPFQCNPGTIANGLMTSTNYKTDATSCPEGRRGACRCFDACAYELYQVLTEPQFATSMATVFDYELDHKITFTRCGIEGNIAHNNGGVVATNQVATTIPALLTAVFCACSISLQWFHAKPCKPSVLTSCGHSLRFSEMLRLSYLTAAASPEMVLSST